MSEIKKILAQGVAHAITTRWFFTKGLSFKEKLVRSREEVSMKMKGEYLTRDILLSNLQGRKLPGLLWEEVRGLEEFLRDLEVGEGVKVQGTHARGMLRALGELSAAVEISLGKNCQTLRGLLVDVMRMSMETQRIFKKLGIEDNVRDLKDCRDIAYEYVVLMVEDIDDAETRGELDECLGEGDEVDG